LSFSSLAGGSALKFVGGGVGTATVGFANSTSGAGTGYQFSINASSSLGADSVGDLGKLAGTFTVASFGATTNITSPGHVSVTETIGLTGSGTLTIKDHNGVNLTGTVTLDNLTDTYNGTGVPGGPVSGIHFTSNGFTGSGATGNGGVILNITGISYAGTEADLLEFVNDDTNRGQLAYAWQIPPVSSLDLKDLTKVGAGTHSQTFSGSLQVQAAAPDGGLTVALLGAALSGVALLKRKNA